ncbi:hypothetical protein [Hyphomicrobium sulfonivorans]|uniref:hypothetical protein n=1 Tax=Hyphomicrobium sulfonivorans TaxID=121290 RepID=UPI00156DC446|nr:hypothetical protein [Hyphomicrobium sulfonivorans]MBI1649509.1 hypothetical protein [Hyphomicrobium sulfonivorans]NSL71425.1 hypothetical protein [Hyphomicrobium sulfonivorans]
MPAAIMVSLEPMITPRADTARGDHGLDSAITTVRVRLVGSTSLPKAPALASATAARLATAVLPAAYSDVIRP